MFLFVSCPSLRRDGDAWLWLSFPMISVFEAARPANSFVTAMGALKVAAKWRRRGNLHKKIGKDKTN
jgi:hypothetical protein